MESDDDIYLNARALTDAAERARYLDAACGADTGLRERLERMLRDAEGAEAFFQPIEKATSGSSGAEGGAKAPGTLIGRYRLIEKLGEGGMGVVYRAEQQEPVQRQVALKIIKLGMDTRQVVARFEAERQALALMDHPNIAKVLDGGAVGDERTADSRGADLNPQGDADRPELAPNSDPSSNRAVRRTEIRAPSGLGRPYFVMELVEGLPITEFCTREQLALEQRLRLFIPVCQAVQHAHQKGIIHRDLKPSNVMVTLQDGVPVPKVIDFGVAKALHQRLTEKTLFTQHATLIGTPAYMSPEQAEPGGVDVDTRSDVYSLGVLLYELLTGTQPFPEQRLRSVAYAEMQRIILHEEPERPSTRLRKTAATAAPPSPAADHRSLATRPRTRITDHRLLATDLDWIVLKCLEKDRNRRYETANGLATDLRRHLESEPVAARPPSTAYRIHKAIRRNRLAFAAAGGIALALVAGVGVSAWQAVRATRAERRAQEETASAKAIKEFLVEQVLAVSPYVAPEPDPGRRVTLERVVRAARTAFATRPELEAELRFAAGIGFSGLGESARALAEFEQAYAIRERVLGPQHSDTLWALAAMVQFYQMTGRTADGQALLTNALAAIRRSPHPWSSGEAEVVWTYGAGLQRLGRSHEALPLVQEAMEVSQRTMNPKDFRLWNKITFLVGILEDAGQTNKAEAVLLDGLQRCEQVHGAEHTLTLQFEKHRAHWLLQRGRWPEALTNLERIVPLYHRVLGTNHNNALDAEGLLAEACEKLGRLDRATELYTSLYPRWASYLSNAYWKARLECQGIAGFFVRQRDYDTARIVFRLLADSFARHPAQSAAEWEMLIQATAATEGWPAAAAVCRQQMDAFPKSLSVWLTKAWVFRYVGDELSYQQVVARVLAMNPGVTTTNVSHLPIEIAALGTFPFATNQVTQLETMIHAMEAALPERPTHEQIRGFRAIAQLQLRLEQFQQCLATLEKVVALQTEPEPYTLLIKAICLHRFTRVGEAQAAMDQAEAIMHPLLRESLAQSEGFLPAWQIYQQLGMRREAQAVLGASASKP